MSLHRTFLCIALHAASLGTPIAHAQEARSAEEERATFTMVDGFVAELVADERVMRKAVAFNFDNAGRMWVTTASDYPLDANEQPEKAAALYRDGGNDNVLIFDTPWAEGLQRPRIWAGREGEGNFGISGFRDSGNLREGAGNSARSKNPEIPKSRNPGIPLAMPMGVLPYKDGAIVQHGADLLFLRDTNADGKADTKEVLLTGFGIEDSHLMPHGFTRGPGDWIYFAQGAFNTSRVKTKEGTEVLVKFCKMMRMKPDGAQFEICSWGPNNIWGFAIDPRGEMWIQEANDMGYPVAPFQPGMTYPGIGDDKPKPYAPVMPQPKKMNDCTMGGTGLSGLALNEDPATWPAPWTGAFMIANPITNKIQAIRVHRDAPGYDGVKLEKLPDFLVSGDKNFRPVAIQFGPDGALYIIDWYNKIISHNEVPRAHPDRDKQRTRIWRIRAKDAPRRKVVSLEKADVRGLVARLGSANQWEANAARFELNDRGLVEEIGDDSPESLRDENNLHRIARDTKKPVAERLRAITALSVYGYLFFDTPVEVAKENNAVITREVLRAVRTLDWSVYEIADYFQRLVEDSDPGVRLALLTQLAANYAEEGPQEWLAIRTLLRFAKPPDSDSLGIRGNLDHRIERYVIRSALERERAYVAKFLEEHRENDLSPEALALIALTIEPEGGAKKLLATLPRLRRPLIADEIALLASQIDTLPSARGALETLLFSANEQHSTLSALARIDSRLLTGQGAETASWQGLIVRAARDLFRREPTNTNGLLIVRLAKNLRLRQLEPDIAAYVREPARTSAEQIEGVKVLRELGSNAVDLFHVLAAANDEQLRRESLLSLASATSERVVPLFVELWLQLSPPLRRIALERLASSKTQASALVRAAKEGAIPADDLDGVTLDKLSAVLGENHPDLTVVLRELKGALRPVLRLSGKPGDIAETKVDLPGPFTIEAWVRLDAGVDNSDNLLGRKGGADINFHDAKLRVFANQTVGDLVIARTAIKPERWTHVAVTRDGAGKFRIYLDGELDAESETTFTESLTGLNIGETHAGRGCAAAYTEFRVWDVARSTEEIRDIYLLSFNSTDAQPDNQHRTSNIEHRTSKEALPRDLVRYMSGAQGWGALKGQARIEQTRDFPELLTAADAAALATKFARYRALASDGGTAENGRALFAAVCMVCHEVKGEGGKIGPTLSGAGAMGTESLLRNILTPNAQLESGYYRHDVELKSGDVLSGFLVSQHEGQIVLRQVGAEDRTIVRSEIKKQNIAKKSLMPEGLLEGLNPEQVRDLFAYLRTLR